MAEERSTESLKKAIVRGNTASVDPLQARNFYKDDALIKAAADAGTVLEVNLAPVFKLPAGRRTQSLRETRIFLEKCVKHNAKFSILSRSDDQLDSKSGRELQAICTQIFGLDQHLAKAAVKPAR